MTPLWRAVGVCLFAFLPIVLAAASISPVGFAVGEAQFVVGQSTVEGQATLFDGDQVRTLYLATRLNLKDGSRYILGIDSEAAVYQDRVSLRYGSAELSNKGRPAHITASSLELAAEKPNSVATVYVSDNKSVTVMVRSGEVKVSRAAGLPVATLKTGQLISFKPGAKGAIRMDSDGALSEVTRVQSEQLAVLADASRGMTCLTPKVEQLARSFAGLSSQLAANQATRSVLLAKVESGMASRSDLQNIAFLDTGSRSLRSASASFGDDLDNVIYQFHHPSPTPDPFVSPHTVHGHLNRFKHHGQHGHTIPGPYPDGAFGHHQTPPHFPTGLSEEGTP